MKILGEKKTRASISPLQVSIIKSLILKRRMLNLKIDKCAQTESIHLKELNEQFIRSELK